MELKISGFTKMENNEPIKKHTGQREKSYSFNEEEILLSQLINDYRTTFGLQSLELVEHVSSVSEEHNIFMIEHNKLSHQNFMERLNFLKVSFRAKTISENLAFDFKNPQSTLAAWLNSPGHLKNLNGNFTHVGISIRYDAQQNPYYTVIFVKK